MLSATALQQLRKVARGDRGRELISEALVCRGYLLEMVRQFPEAIACCGEALSRTDPKDSPRSERIHVSGAHNLALAMSKSPHHSAKTAALQNIRRARELLKGQVRSAGRYRLLWVEGLVWAAVGLDRRAERAFRIALEGFRALQLPWEIALVGLDLGEILHLAREWGALAELAGETYKRFRVLSGDTEALAALSQWVSAIQAQNLSDEITGKARELIAAGVFKGAKPKK
ncbi:MAG: hypothetical protein GY719_25230 [bacterium]|nr:hypothetical protein [bacterium]